MAFDYKIVITKNGVDSEKLIENTPMTFNVSKRFSVDDPTGNANELFFSRDLSVNGTSTDLFDVYDMVEGEVEAYISLAVKLHESEAFSKILNPTLIKYVELRQDIGGSASEGSEASLNENLRFNFRTVE